MSNYLNEYYRGDDWEENDDPIEFYDPNSGSALRAGNRIYPCPTCGEPNSLTQQDVALHYQCDACADRAEGGGY